MIPVMTAPARVRFTYEDYLLLPEDRRAEIIEGELFMTPVPTPYHQRIALEIASALRAHVRSHALGEVFIAPCDVKLSDSDVVQPDILFISKDRLSIIEEKYISAAPDLIVEILSPATAERDQTLKRKLYERSGVRELWIASPEARTIEVLSNAGSGFRREAIYGSGDRLRSPLFPGLEIAIAEVF
jgi:Uma2 family endonuclease